MSQTTVNSHDNQGEQNPLILVPIKAAFELRNSSIATTVRYMLAMQVAFTCLLLLLFVELSFAWQAGLIIVAVLMCLIASITHQCLRDVHLEPEDIQDMRASGVPATLVDATEGCVLYGPRIPFWIAEFRTLLKPYRLVVFAIKYKLTRTQLQQLQSAFEFWEGKALEQGQQPLTFEQFYRIWKLKNAQADKPA